MTFYLWIFLFIAPSLQPKDMSKPPSSYNEILLVMSTSLHFKDPNFTDSDSTYSETTKTQESRLCYHFLLKFLLPKSLVTSRSQINALFLALVDVFNTID